MRRAPEGFEVIREIACGGMGIVYLARQLSLDRVVALKVMIAGEHATAEALARFHREARLAAKLDHAHIVHVFEVGLQAPLYWLSMEYVEGVPLSERVGRGDLSVRESLEIARKLAMALQYAHDRRVVHRDIKPSNVLLDRAGEPKLADFGLARDAALEGLTAPGMVLGTPAYASPEQAGGEVDRVGPRSDVYSLGATLYEMLTGRRPFSGENAIAILFDVISREPVPPRGVRAEIPADAEAVCLHAMEKDPERRYGSAAEFAEDLGRCLAGEPVLASRPSDAARRFRAVARSRWAIALAVVSLLVAVLVAVAWHRGRGAAEGVAAAARCEAEGDLDRARDLLVGALATHAGDPEAREALDRVEAKVRARDAARDAERDRAVREADVAEEALRKSREASEVLGRWAKLRGPLARLEETRFDDGLLAEEVLRTADGIWPEFERFRDETPDAPSARATMLAFLGWARVAAGRTAEGVEWMRQARRLDPDLPYGALLEGMVGFRRYVGLASLPETSTDLLGLRFLGLPEEDPEMASIRVEIEALLDEAGAARVWGKEGRDDFLAAMDGMRETQRGEWEAAERSLSRAIEGAELSAFRADLLLARAKVRYLRKDFERGVEDLRRVLEVRPRHAVPWFYVGMFVTSAAQEASSRGTDPTAGLREAVEALDRAVALRRSFPEAYEHRAKARVFLGKWASTNHADPRAAWEASIADFTEADRLSPGAPGTLVNRANVSAQLGEWEAMRGIDPTARYLSAIGDCTDALRIDPKSAHALDERGGASMLLGQWKMMRALSPEGDFETALADLGRAIELWPERAASILNSRAIVHRSLATWLVSRGRDDGEEIGRALADFDASARAEPRFWPARANRAQLLELLGRFAEAVAEYDGAIDGAKGSHPDLGRWRARAASCTDAEAAGRSMRWVAALMRGTEAVRAGDYATAREAYEEGLAGAGEGTPSEAFLRDLLLEAHYNLTCVFSLGSVGKSSPSAAAVDVPPDEASRLRDEAFRHLRAALDLGHSDRIAVEADLDLVPLHGDARWMEILAPRR